LAGEAEAALWAQNVPLIRVETIASLLVKYAGTDTPLRVPLGDEATAVREAFEALHQRRFGFVSPSTALVVEALAVEAIGHADAGDAPDLGVGADSQPKPLATLVTRMAGAEHATPVFDRAALPIGGEVAGPAIVREDTGTTVIEPGWRATVDRHLNLIIDRVAALAPRQAAGTQADPVMLEVFNNLFMAVAEEMGFALQNTAYSVNIKERLDFSCALFSRDGDLIANAPHMPVHLGSMGDSVRAIRDGRLHDGRGLKPGDVYMLNAPYNGGTHLPDVTVVMPVFDAAGVLTFYVAARGHQGDIGGITPGSMPPNSRTVEEEGVLIENFLLVEGGRFLEAEVRALLASGKWPARNPDQNIGDLKAQVAACARGAESLTGLVAEFGQDVVEAYMAHVQDNAEEAVRRVLATLADGDFAYELDDGGGEGGHHRRPRGPHGAGRLHGDQRPGPDQLQRPGLDLPGGGAVRVPHPGRRRDPDERRLPAAGRAGDPRGLDAAAALSGGGGGGQCRDQSGGGRRPVWRAGRDGRGPGDDEQLHVRRRPAAVLRDHLRRGGGGAGFDGADAVQTHMTNSRLTDPEVLESRYPVLVEAFSIRCGSGGAGAHRGGDGVVRRIGFREPMTATLLSNRRRVAPFGLGGGGAGMLGSARVERADGSVQALGATDAVEVAAGDAIVIETPGGGGYG
jgi:5-oxoprolinase (ATP-hydrolysing)